MLRYLLLNKPYGVLSQFTPDLPGQRTLAEFDLPPHIYPAGRLDLDSEGLLLLTDDGDLIHRLLKPGAHPRTYIAQVEGIPSPESLHRLTAGLVIQGYHTLPCAAELLPDLTIPDRDPPIRTRAAIPTAWIRLELREGKNRQVRRMTAAIGHPTLRLIRTRIGQIELADLPPGKWRELSAHEQTQFLST